MRSARKALYLSPSPPAPHTPPTPTPPTPSCSYLLRLFRDFLFHGVDVAGAPDLEWGAVAEGLSKLDAGVPERVVLLGRDEAAMLVVSYADVRRCLAGAYAEVRAAQAEAGGGGG